MNIATLECSVKFGENDARAASGPTPYLHLDFFLSVRRATLPFYTTDIARTKRTVYERRSFITFSQRACISATFTTGTIFLCVIGTSQHFHILVPGAVQSRRYDVRLPDSWLRPGETQRNSASSADRSFNCGFERRRGRQRNARRKSTYRRNSTSGNRIPQ